MGSLTNIIEEMQNDDVSQGNSILSPMSTSSRESIEIIISQEEKFRNDVKNIVQKVQETTQTKDDIEDQILASSFSTQVSRILQIMDLCIIRCKMAFCLPAILYEKNLVRRFIVNEEERRKFVKICKKYMFKTMEEMPCAKMANNELIIDPELTELINFSFHSGLTDLIPNYQHTMSREAKHFIMAMEDLRKLIAWRTVMTAPRALAKEKLLHKMYCTNEKTKQRIEELKTSLLSDEKQLQETYYEKLHVVSEHRKELSSIRQKCRDKITIDLSDSLKEMNSIAIKSKQRIIDLSDELDKIKETYENVCRDNKMNEKKMVDWKNKITQQLIGWLNTYDLEVGDRTRQLFELQEEFEKAQEDHENWMVDFHCQEEQYEIMKEALNIEWEEAKQRKLISFIMNRAARVIQRHWRAILAIRRPKKGKKGKKGKGKGKKK